MKLQKFKESSDRIKSTAKYVVNKQRGLGKVSRIAYNVLLKLNNFINNDQISAIVNHTNNLSTRNVENIKFTI